MKHLASIVPNILHSVLENERVDYQNDFEFIFESMGTAKRRALIAMKFN